MTYSLESAFVRAYAAGAVAVQAVVDLVKGVERITKPVRRGGFDEDAAGEFICGTQHFGSKAHHQCACILAADHPNEGDCHLCGCGERWRDMWDDIGTGAINGGEPQQVTLSGREFERYLDGALNEPYIDEDDETNRCYFCGDPTENLVNADDEPEFVCEDCCDDTPNPTEPGLDDSELIGVRGLLQERYGDRAAAYDRYWNAKTPADESSALGEIRANEELLRVVLGEPPRTSRAGSPLNTGKNPSCLHHAPHYVTPIGQDHRCYCARPQGHPLDDYGHRPHICPCGQLWADLPTKSSAPVKSTPGTGAGTDPPPTIASAAPQCAVDGEGPAGSTHSPESPAGRSDFAKGVDAAANIVAEEAQRAWREVLDSPFARPVLDGMDVARRLDQLTRELRDHANEYSHPDDAAAEWIGGAVPVITAVLAAHVPHERSPDHYVECVDPHGIHALGLDDWHEWRYHIAPIIANALTPQPK